MNKGLAEKKQKIVRPSSEESWFLESFKRKKISETKLRPVKKKKKRLNSISILILSFRCFVSILYFCMLAIGSSLEFIFGYCKDADIFFYFSTQGRRRPEMTFVCSSVEPSVCRLIFKLSQFFVFSRVPPRYCFLSVSSLFSKARGRSRHKERPIPPSGVI